MTKVSSQSIKRTHSKSEIILSPKHFWSHQSRNKCFFFAEKNAAAVAFVMTHFVIEKLDFYCQEFVIRIDCERHDMDLVGKYSKSTHSAHTSIRAAFYAALSGLNE